MGAYKPRSDMEYVFKYGTARHVDQRDFMNGIFSPQTAATTLPQHN